MVTINLDNDVRISNISTIQRKFFTQITRIRNENILNQKLDFDKLVVSNVIFNFLSDSSGFFQIEKIDSRVCDYDIVKMGYITQRGYTMNDLGVWIDLNLDRNKMYLTLEENKLRDFKIDEVLEDISESKIYRIDILVKSFTIF